VTTGPAFFNGSSAIWRVVVAVAITYVAMLTMLRISGKRTLAQTNVFDFVFIITLGSMAANTILSGSIAIAEGLVAIAALIGLQFVASWLTTRSRSAEQVINAEPVLLLRHGHFLQQAMRHARVTGEEIRAAVRREGLSTLDDVEAVVLETDGSFSVTRRSPGQPPSSMRDLAEYREPRDE
jgi:uncharacterized membrane protein YcaP (DUF421 family)